MIDRSIVQIVIENNIKENGLAKNNQKKEKAERNKEYAKKFKKRTVSKFGNRRNYNDNSSNKPAENN